MIACFLLCAMTISHHFEPKHCIHYFVSKPLLVFRVHNCLNSIVRLKDIGWYCPCCGWCCTYLDLGNILVEPLTTSTTMTSQTKTSRRHDLAPSSSSSIPVCRVLPSENLTYTLRSTIRSFGICISGVGGPYRKQPTQKSAGSWRDFSSLLIITARKR